MSSYRFIHIAVPTEGPEIPEGWTHESYEVVNEKDQTEWPNQRWHDRTTLEGAGTYYAYAGQDGHEIICRISRDGWEAFSTWGMNTLGASDDLYGWGPWKNWYNGEPFDFTLLNEVAVEPAHDPA